jgi:hypothetical protein
LLSATIVEDLELIWVCCGWLSWKSNSYSCLWSWRWVIVTPETCRAIVR